MPVAPPVSKRYGKEMEITDLSVPPASNDPQAFRTRGYRLAAEAIGRIEELPSSHEALIEIGIDDVRSGVWWFMTLNETLVYL